MTIKGGVHIIYICATTFKHLRVIPTRIFKKLHTQWAVTLNTDLLLLIIRVIQTLQVKTYLQILNLSDEVTVPRPFGISVSTLPEGQRSYSCNNLRNCTACHAHAGAGAEWHLDPGFGVNINYIAYLLYVPCM